MELIIEKLNETYIRIQTEPGIARELHDAFSFMVPNFRFTPAYKTGRWDGRIHLFNLRDRTIYAGLLPKILKFAQDRDYSVSGYLGPQLESTQSAQISSWAASLGIPGITLRDFQETAVEDAIRASRGLIVSPTGSGKSLIAYLLTRWYNKRTLIVVPTIGLIEQMRGDFEDYGCPIPIQTIHESKVVTSQIVISTWQSIWKLPKKWFDQFELVIGDECHLFKANCLTSIMEKSSSVPYRFGMTGTLDDSKINRLTLEGLFGTVHTTTSTAKLIVDKILADFKIECLVLKHPEETRKLARAATYEQEIKLLLESRNRNAMICNLVRKLTGNTLLLFQFIEHGKFLYEVLKKSTNRPVYFIAGEIKGKEREEIRNRIENEKDVILVASVGTTSTGINIISLRHIIFAHPSKAKIRILQSIGRVLRRSKYKQEAILWDIADDLSWKKRKNYTIQHFMKRVEIYSKENFKYKLHQIQLGQ